jgi:hypothetical protein
LFSGALAFGVSLFLVILISLPYPAKNSHTKILSFFSVLIEGRKSPEHPQN